MESKIWGKSKINDREILLITHIKDALDVFEYLKNKINSQELSEIIKIVIEFHDAGKVLPYFQIKTLNNSEYKPFDIYTNIPHSILSALLINESVLKTKLEDIFKNDKQKIETYSKFIISAIAYHHWRENFYDIVEGYTNIFERFEKLVNDKTKWDQIEKNLINIYSQINGNSIEKIQLNRKWLEGLINGIRFADYVIPPYLLYRMPKRIEIDKTFLKDWILISGFTMLSDHFASYIESQAEDNITADKVEIEPLDYVTIKEKISKELSSKLKEKYDESKIWQFQNINEFKNHNTILIAPTGIGKTEFSFLWSNGDKFFYTLPIRTAVNQIFYRTKTIFGENKTGLLHSDADIYLYGDGGENESIKTYELAKNLAYPAIISTGDQFFPYSLRPPSYEKIFAKFSYSRLIIDEVQAYNPKAAAIVVKFIEHIIQMGGKFLLMTATIPPFIQKEIEFRIFDEKSKEKNFKILNLFEQDKELSNFAKHKIQLKIENYNENAETPYSKELLSEIINKSKENGGSRVLVVLNTIKQAQKVFNELKKIKPNEVEIKLFHSRYTQQHRNDIENELYKFIGNNNDSRKDKKPKILVATQVIEASLDLDADYLFTEIAPWDSLIQRMGRVLREAHPKLYNLKEVTERRYNASEIPINIFIIVYNADRENRKNIYESGKGFVYDNDLLKISLKLLENEQIDISNWLRRPIIDFNKLSEIQLCLTEAYKNKLVKLLFEGLPSESNYLKQFYKMLEILDAGFMSERKNEAQKIFREINNINVISNDKKEEFFSDLKNFYNNYDSSKKYAYIEFKNKILAKYLISVEINKVKSYLTEINNVAFYITISENFTDKKIISILKNWLFGIYFVDLKYAEENGLVGINENSSFEIM